jgi:hypothetical protein
MDRQRFAVQVARRVSDPVGQGHDGRETPTMTRPPWELVEGRREAAPVEDADISMVILVIVVVVVVVDLIETRKNVCLSLTELSNLARLRRPPSTILSRLISALANSLLAFFELVTEPWPPSLSLKPFSASLLRSAPLPCVLDPRLFRPGRRRGGLTGSWWAVLAEMLRRPRPGGGDALRSRAATTIREGDRDGGWP